MKFILSLALGALATFHCFAQPAVVTAQASDQATVRANAFEQVWKTVNEKHYDPTFGGVEWNKVRTVYQPQALMPTLTDKEFHDVLRRMLGELKLSHFGIHPPAAEMVAAQTGRGVTGIDVLMLDGVPVINRVDATSAAAKAGVASGQIVQQIDGKPWKVLAAPLEASLAARKVTPAMRLIYLERTLEGAINSKPGTTLVLEVLDGDERQQKFNIERQPFAGEMSQAVGNFPPQEVFFESRLLPDNIGYVRFNMWVIPQMAKLRKAVAEFANARAIIIDLRGNPGGVGGMAPGLAGLLFKEKASLGSMKTRGGSMEFVAFPQPNPFPGKVILLTDHGTGSTSEVFAAGMQETGRATVVGETTAGAVLPSVFEKLPTGYLFQYAISDYRSPRNILIEGRGVIPDIEVKQTRESLVAGGDAQLAAAIKLIQAPGVTAATAGRWSFAKALRRMKAASPFEAKSMKLKLTIPLTATLALALSAAGQKAEPAKPSAKLPTVKEVLDKYVKALGGREAIEKVKGRTTTGTLELLPMNLKGTFESVAAPEGKSYSKLVIAGIGDMLESTDGKSSWSVNPIQGSRERTGAELAQSKVINDFYREIRLEKLFPKLELKGVEKVGEREAYVIAAAADGVPTEKWYFDTQTGLLIRSDFTAVALEGNQPMTVFYEDHRSVDGILIPFRVRTQTPSFQIVMTTTELKHGAPADESKFAKPKS